MAHTVLFPEGWLVSAVQAQGSASAVEAVPGQGRKDPLRQMPRCGAATRRAPALRDVLPLAPAPSIAPHSHLPKWSRVPSLCQSFMVKPLGMTLSFHFCLFAAPQFPASAFNPPGTCLIFSCDHWREKQRMQNTPNRDILNERWEHSES